MSGQNLKDKAYIFIKDKISNCEYKPGQFLVESELIHALGISRTPVREALNKLEQENLIKIMPKRGIYVNDITLGLVNEIFEVRILLEPYIITNYGKNIPKDLLNRQRILLSTTGEDAHQIDVFSKDDDLHQLIVKTSCNSYVISLMKQIYTQNHRLRIITGQQLDSRLHETCEEHLMICDCLLAEDIQGAAVAMRNHLMNSKSAAINVMLNSNTKQMALIR